MSASPTVAVLLVSHDGGRWLPSVIEGIRAQDTAPDRIVPIDTGSLDSSADLVEVAFGAVHRVPGTTSFPAAVQIGLARLAETGAAPDWVWILHDDSNPDPHCLSELLAAAEADPGAAVLGPKLREWPSLRRLLELGVTISGTGRRETGLERGEFDQGQHDEVRTVLAVNTAGMLVRHDVLVGLGGFDEALPIFGNDIDFGWRAAAAGHRTVIVPRAVVFHVEAAHRGLRRTALTGRHTHYQERRAALHTLLANAPARSLPFRVVRMVLGTLLRMLGFLLVRAVGQSLDEFAALVSVLSRPGQIRAARRSRQPAAGAVRHDVRPLLAPRWLPYRHGLDFLSDLVAAFTNQAADVAERRRIAAAQHDPSSFAARRRDEDDESPFDDQGFLARFLTNPVAVILALVTVLAVIGARVALGPVTGGGLSPAPGGAGDWWSLHFATWHELGTGTAVPAPAYVLPLALAASLLLGSATAAISSVMVLAVPVALWGAWRFLRVVGRLVAPSGAPRWLVLVGAAAYAVVPATSGAWGSGRLGVVVVAAGLPWLAHSALGFAEPDPDRRRRAGWRTGLLLTGMTAFAPTFWILAFAAGVLLLAVVAVVAPSVVRDRSTWLPPMTTLLLPVVLLVPWWLPLLLESGVAGLLTETGRLPSPAPDGLEVLAGRLVTEVPLWAGLVVPVLALLALAPRATRLPVLVCWLVALPVAAVAALLSTLTVDVASGTTPPGLGAPVVLLAGLLVVAATIGLQGLLRTPGVTRSVGMVLTCIAAVVPVLGLGWFVVAGAGDLTDEIDSGIPAYMEQSSEIGSEHGVLVIRGEVGTGLRYDVRRGSGTTVGQDEVLAHTPPDAQVSADVQGLVSRPTPELVDTFADRGIEYVVLPAPVDTEVAAVLDSADGLVQASAEDRSTRAWQVDRDLDPDALAGESVWWRTALLVAQLPAILVALVMCVPARRRDER